MSKLLIVGTFIFTYTLCGPLAFSQSSVNSPSPKQHAYIDDDDQRPLADLRFDVEPKQQQNLKITVSAMGPNVEPIAGFRGIQGANRYTAEELELILAGHHVVEVVTEFDDGQSVSGRILSGRYGTLPERRLLPSGRIDFLAQTLRDYPLELVVDPQTQSSGRRRTVVIVNGRPRLRCVYNIINGRVEGLEVQSLGGHSFLADMFDDGNHQKGSRIILTAVQETKPPVSEAEWTARDLEGKWVLLSAEIASEPTKIPAWVEFLKQKKEFQLLEWMAIYVPDAFKTHGVAEALKTSDAPQWIRVVAWHTAGPFYLGHGEQQAQSLLTSAPGLAEHWLQTHKDKIEPWEGMIEQLYGGFQKDKFAPVDSSDYLPPLQVANVFPHLSDAKDAVDYSQRKQADSGVVYTHQVVREINGIVVSGRRDPELLKTVRELTKHSNNEIRQAAFLAHTYILPQTPATERLDDFVKVIDDSAESGMIRESALMGFSYHTHPSVLLKLHQVAADPQHAAWSAAVSRVGDIGKGFSVSLLKQLQNSQLTDEQSKLLADSLKRLTDRESSKQNVAAWDMARRIALAVYAQQTSDPNAAIIKAWVLESKEHMVDKELQNLKAKWNFDAVNEFWLPTPVNEFQKGYETIKAEVVK